MMIFVFDWIDGARLIVIVFAASLQRSYSVRAIKRR